MKDVGLSLAMSRASNLPPPKIEIESLSVTENGIYTAEEGKAFNPVDVNILDKINYKDIFNHGDIIGLNPLYTFYEKFKGKTSTVLDVTNGYINLGRWDNKVLGFRQIILPNIFKKIHIRVKCPDGSHGSYNNSQLSLTYVSKGWQTSSMMSNATKSWYFTNYNDPTMPYEISEETDFEFDISEYNKEPFYLRLSSCDCNFYIYSLWLE